MLPWMSDVGCRPTTAAAAAAWIVWRSSAAPKSSCSAAAGRTGARPTASNAMETLEQRPASSTDSVTAAPPRAKSPCRRANSTNASPCPAGVTAASTSTSSSIHKTVLFLRARLPMSRISSANGPRCQAAPRPASPPLTCRTSPYGPERRGDRGPLRSSRKALGEHIVVELIVGQIVFREACSCVLNHGR